MLFHKIGVSLLRAQSESPHPDTSLRPRVGDHSRGGDVCNVITRTWKNADNVISVLSLTMKNK